MTKQLFVTFLLVATALAVTAEQDHNEHQTLTNGQAWLFGILTGFGLLAAGLLAAVLIVSLKTCITDKTYKIIISLLYALGCGAMIGDAMVHILPDAYGNDETNTNYVSLVFICSVVTFILIERIFACCGISHAHCDNPTIEIHDHDLTGQGNCEQVHVKKCTGEAGGKIEIDNIQDDLPVSGSIDKIENPQESIVKVKGCEHVEEQTEEGTCDCCLQLKGKDSAGYLIFVTEFVCVLFDGFAIGVSFASRDANQYIPVVIAVFAHEIPTFMGNVGILLKSKFTNCQTIICNTLITGVSLVGIIFGLALGEIGEAAQMYVLTFVAGNFIYIGADMWKKMMKSSSHCLSVVEFLVFSMGVGIMYLVLLVESDEEGHNH